MQIKFLFLFIVFSFAVSSSIDSEDNYYFANEESDQIEEVNDEQNTNADNEVKEKKKKRRLFGLLPPKKDKEKSESIESDEKKGKRRLFGLLPPKKEKKKKDIDEVPEENIPLDGLETQGELNTESESNSTEINNQIEEVDNNEEDSLDTENLQKSENDNEYSGNREILKNIISQQDVMINLMSQLNYSSDSTSANLNTNIESSSPQIDSSELYSRIYQNLYTELLSLVQGKFDEIDNKLSKNDKFHSSIQSEINSTQSNIEELNMGLLTRIQSLELSMIQLENIVENRISKIEDIVEDRISTIEDIVGMLNSIVEGLERYDNSIDNNISSLGDNINSRLENITGDITNMSTDISGLETINQELIIGSLRKNINVNQEIKDTPTRDDSSQDETLLEDLGTHEKKLSKEEYKTSYDKGYSKYLLGEHSQAINIFNDLLNDNSNNDLADNCQYWIGEIFYNRKEYENALDAFYKVFEFEDNNKEYYAQYKIALCYLSLDDIPNALKEFQNMIDNHPADSELVKKSKRLINKYSNN